MNHSSGRKWGAGNRLGPRCVQVHVGKKLTIALCVLALTGCAQTVEGKAVVEDSWQGLGLSESQSSSPTSSTRPRATAPTPSASKPASFDPCEFDDISLRVFVGVDPETRSDIPGGGGCTWTGDGLRFTAGINGEVNRESIATTPGVTDLVEFEAYGQMVQLFVFEGDKCISLSEIDNRTVQFTMSEVQFDSYCFNLRIATRLLLGDA